MPGMKSKGCRISTPPPSFWYLETGSHYAAQAGLELATLLVACTTELHRHASSENNALWQKNFLSVKKTNFLFRKFPFLDGRV
jgi:hypothetical protein